MWSEYGCTSLALSLSGLPICGCALMVGAHPDDEDNALLALLAKGMFLDSYYLVATYGEGGQNECGPELYEALGVLRKQELAAARRIDGARQLYLGAHDFGYSKSARETFAKWDRNALLAATVAALRQTRPDIVLTHHDTVSGHGHHQAVGWLIHEAVQAAADSSRFPEQLEEGLAPWRVSRFYVYARPSGGGKGAQPLAAANVGAYSPLLGMSYYQLGQASRSMHKCQGMGGEGARGDRWRRYHLVLENGAPPAAGVTGVAEATAGPDSIGSACAPRGLAESMELTMPGLVARLSGDGHVLARLTALAREADACARAAAAAFSPIGPQSPGIHIAIAGHLAHGLDATREMLHYARRRGGREPGLSFSSAAALSQRMEVKVAQFEAALMTLAAVECVIRTDPSPALTAPGGSVSLEVQLWRRGPLEADAGEVRVVAPGGWSCEPQAGSAAEGAPAIALPESVPMNAFTARRFVVTAPLWAQVTPALEPDPVSVECEWLLRAAGVAAPTRITTSHPAGITVVPPVEVSLEPQSLMVAASRLPLTLVFSVTLKNNIHGAASGTVRLSLPEGISSSRGSSLDFSLASLGDQITLSLPVAVSRACGAPRSCVRTVEAEARVNAGGAMLTSGQSCQLIAYSHIEPRLLPRKAMARLCVADAVVPEGLKVGYVDAGIDNVADYMEQLGAAVVRLDDDDLRLRDLGQFDAVVLGVRAYRLRHGLAAVNSRLLDYVRRGGTMVVQYHKTSEWDPGYAPYPLYVGDGRVSDETAPIEILDAAHPAIVGPNPLNDTDWSGWVQERGLYFASRWADDYRPLVRCADPGELAQSGAWLIAHYGAGAYMYNALSVYRQIESLVPGGARIWCNMISYRQKGSQRTR